LINRKLKKIESTKRKKVEHLMNFLNHGFIFLYTEKKNGKKIMGYFWGFLVWHNEHL
jgi:hypothetical protein